jgi:serine phosphatase RsbU (regulator of sigma subunit)
VVITPHGSLGGTFFEALPSITTVLGVLLALAAALMTDRLARRRRYAEQLAGVLDRVAAENRQLYTEQRTIAQTLQHALLPESVPVVEGLETTARYVPAGSDIEVGGDWYDLVVIDDQHVLLVIGDVTGHGLRAASTMASLRFATLAYAARDHRPGSVLDQLSDYVGRQAHDYFATVLCVLIDVGAHQLTVASAGHIAPLVIGPDGGQFVDITVGVPIGVERESPYDEVTITVAPRSTLVAFTDGLVERRGESLDIGLARLRRMATERPLPLEDLVETLANDLVSNDHHDDTAIMGIRWRN